MNIDDGAFGTNWSGGLVDLTVDPQRSVIRTWRLLGGQPCAHPRRDRRGRGPPVSDMVAFQVNIHLPVIAHRRCTAPSFADEQQLRVPPAARDTAIRPRSPSRRSWPASVWIGLVVLPAGLRARQPGPQLRRRASAGLERRPEAVEEHRPPQAGARRRTVLVLPAPVPEPHDVRRSIASMRNATGYPATRPARRYRSDRPERMGRTPPPRAASAWPRRRSRRASRRRRDRPRRRWSTRSQCLPPS